jgi:predicted porin
MYGVVDMGYHNEKLSANGATLVKRQGLNSVVAGSRIGLRGTEDLGGGLKAGFVLEYAIQPDEATTSMANRQSFVSLTGGFGDIKLGRQLTLHHINQGAGDLLGNLNAQAGYVGGLDSAIRSSNAVTYTSPSFSGVTVAAQKGFGETPVVSGANTVKANEQTAIRVSYSSGPLAAGFATETIKTASTPALTWILPVLPAETVDKKRANNLFATYDLGVARIGFVNNNTKYTNDGDSDKWTANTLTAAVPMGATTLHASVGNGKIKDDVDTTKARGFQLGVQYALSKRTSAYAYTGQTKIKDDDGSAKYQTHSVGIRHTF